MIYGLNNAAYFKFVDEVNKRARSYESAGELPEHAFDRAWRELAWEKMHGSGDNR